MRLDTCIDINIGLRQADHYAWLFTSKTIRLALEITFLRNKYFLLQITYELISQSRKFNMRVGPNKSREIENF